MANKYHVDAKTTWTVKEVHVCNYPPAWNSLSYIILSYIEEKEGISGKVTIKEVLGQPIYFNDLPASLRTLATIIGEAQGHLLTYAESFDCRKKL